MKKILHLSHTDISSDSRILKELTALTNSDVGFCVTAIGIHDLRESHKSKDFVGFKLSQINLWSRQWRLLPDVIRHAFSVLELLVKMTAKGLLSRPDIIHCHDTLVLPVGGVIKLFTGARLIYDAHELESNRNGLSPLLGKLTLRAEKILWPLINGLVVVSPSIKQWYHENLGVKKTTVILNSPELSGDSVEFDGNYFRDRFDIPAESKVFLYIGIVGPGRGIELLLEVFARPDVNAHVVFLGYGSLIDDVIKSSVTYPNIHYHPAVPHKDVVPIARSADVGLCMIENVSLSDYYCLPNKLFEYAFSGVPVLASAFPDIKAIVDAFNLGEYADLDAESIFSTVKKYEAMENLPKIDTSQLFELSWQTQACNLIGLYKELLREDVKA